MLLTERLDTLTVQQLQTLEETRDHWRSVGLSLFSSDKEKALAGMRLAYQAAGLNQPKLIVWLRSPRAAATAIRLLRSDLEWPVQLVPEQRAVWDEVWKQCVRQIESNIGVPQWDELRRRFRKEAEQRGLERYGRYIEKSVKEDFGERMGIWVWRYLRQNAGASTFGAIRTDVEVAVRDKVNSQISSQVKDVVYRELVPAIRQQVYGAIGEPVRQMLATNNGILAGRLALECGYGHLDADWLSYFDFFATLGLKGSEPLEGMKKLAESCGWWWPYENICFLTARPVEMHRDNRGRLHNETGMAMRYSDGWGFYAWHGILVPEYVILLPEPIDLEMIHNEPNVEVRRVLIERFGLGNYLKSGSVVKIHQDECGTLYSMALRSDEPIYVVHVINSTAEPDGSFREYFLRVPPTMKRAREAVAWTFGLTEEEYLPLAQT